MAIGIIRPVHEEVSRDDLLDRVERGKALFESCIECFDQARVLDQAPGAVHQRERLTVADIEHRRQLGIDALGHARIDPT